MKNKTSRTWALTAEPMDAPRVRGQRTGTTWTQRVAQFGRTFWVSDEDPDRRRLTWTQLLNDEGELTEVLETEVQAAARRLREDGADVDHWSPTADQSGVLYAEDIATVLRHVLNGGTL